MNKIDLRLGDILVQRKGEPWVTGCRLFTGYPYPHSRVVSNVLPSGDVFTYEEGPYGFHETELTNLVDDYVVCRPKTTEEACVVALQWMERHLGGPYDYYGFLMIALFYRFGLRTNIPDEDLTADNKAMWCSRIIATGFYRAGFDSVPHILNSNTMPWDFVISSSMEVLN